MDITLEFESKMQIIGGEKLYSARDIMVIFGYNKWERFLGAIERTILNISDDEVIGKNFIKRILKNTGGRPGIDYYLTLGGCYLVLKYCDDRKENVTSMKRYLKEILEIMKNEEKKQINYKKYFYIFFVGLIFLFLFILLVLNILNLMIKTKDDNILKDDFLAENNLIIDNNFEDENVLVDNKDIPLIIDNNIFKDSIYTYIDNPEKEELFIVSKDFNLRNNFTKNLGKIDIVKAYFEFGNNGLFRDSCSLLTKKHCITSNNFNSSVFSNYWEKVYKYELIDSKISNIDENVVCVKYKYKLKYDESNEYIFEKFAYVLNENDGVFEIKNRICESIEKNGRKISCPFKLNKYYCEGF